MAGRCTGRQRSQASGKLLLPGQPVRTGTTHSRVRQRLTSAAGDVQDPAWGPMPTN